MPAEVDVDTMVSCILDVPGYLTNVRYVEDIEVHTEHGPGDVTYLQRISLPGLGKLQTVLRLTDLGEEDGFRVVTWEQEDAATAALDKKQGSRTAYNHGGWLLKPDRVLYALSSSPLKEDVGSLKFAVMTKGADAMVSDTLKGNIEGMLAWADRVRAEV